MIKYVCDQCGNTCEPRVSNGLPQSQERIYEHKGFRILVLVVRPLKAVGEEVEKEVLGAKVLSGHSASGPYGNPQDPAADLCAGCIAECIRAGATQNG